MTEERQEARVCAARLIFAAQALRCLAYGLAAVMAVGAAALVLTLDPQVVILGGGYSRSADLLIDPLERELRRLCLRVPEIRASNLGADSVALGALRVALDQVDARLFTDGMPAPLTLHA
ncbi:ROK family protein [Nonomuraea sp. 3-1Str]|uniref:ROK family protein n=1 Tax=Nonomuraea sp. 3-1Str TaxID=2929801 RepID=UPI00285975FC|nr:ROK family protein [Nonomuraea sp. 3-1Str]MDR8413622.1 ROK family protein [Nonomuraea sp. 3-1Str]